MLKNLFLSVIYFFLSLIVFAIFITIFNYFDILNIKLINILKLIVPIISIFVSSYILGSKSNKLGYIEGLKLGSVIIIILIIITLITKSFSLKSLIYYLILLLSSILGSMIGINFKRNS